jgi:hypothetical protein
MKEHEKRLRDLERQLCPRPGEPLTVQDLTDNQLAGVILGRRAQANELSDEDLAAIAATKEG